jgi:hypothetical protein
MVPATAGVDDDAADWFESDGVDDDLFTDADRQFLAALRERAIADGWPCEPDDTFVFHVDNRGRSELHVILTIGDAQWTRRLFTYGLVFDGSHVIGDRVHDQTYDFEGATEAAMEFSGPLAFLVDRAAEWFASILERRSPRKDSSGDGATGVGQG